MGGTRTCRLPADRVPGYTKSPLVQPEIVSLLHVIYCLKTINTVLYFFHKIIMILCCVTMKITIDFDVELPFSHLHTVYTLFSQNHNRPPAEWRAFLRTCTWRNWLGASTIWPVPPCRTAPAASALPPRRARPIAPPSRYSTRPCHSLRPGSCGGCWNNTQHIRHSVLCYLTGSIILLVVKNFDF